MMQTQIPRGLQALMQASQVLSSQASPTAPGPQGPQPTVAERVNQQIKQMSQPRPEPGGIMNLPPGLKDVGQQAGIAGQIMAQRQAQQQQMAQDPQAVAQMAAQMVRGQGVDQLPVNMGFKEGGIIGFQGEGRSDVPEASVPATVDEIRQRLVAAVKSGDMNAVRLYQSQLAEAQARSAPEPSLDNIQVGGPSALMPSAEDITAQAVEAPRQGPTRHVLRGSVGATQKPETTSHVFRGSVGSSSLAPSADSADLKPIDSGAQFPTRADRLPSFPPGGIEQLLQAGARPPSPAPRPAPPTAPKAPAAATTPPAAQPAGIDASGIAPIDITKGIDQLAPDRTKEQINRQRALYEEREKLKASMPDQFEAGITALEKDKTLRKELLKSKQERDNFNRMIAFFQDLKTKGNQYGSVQDAIFAREEAERLADAAHEKGVIELRKAQQADKLGDVDRKIAFEDKANDMFKVRDQMRIQAAQVTSGVERARFEQESQNVRTAAEIGQRVAEAKERFAIERQRLAQLERQGAERKAIDQANDALGRWTNALRLFETAKEKIGEEFSIKIGRAITPEAAQKDPKAAETRANAIARYDAEVKKAYDTIVAPAEQAYNVLSKKAYGEMPSLGPRPSGGGIDPAAAAAELARRQQRQ